MFIRELDQPYPLQIIRYLRHRETLRALHQLAFSLRESSILPFVTSNIPIILSLETVPTIGLDHTEMRVLHGESTKSNTTDCYDLTMVQVCEAVSSSKTQQSLIGLGINFPDPACLTYEISTFRSLTSNITGLAIDKIPDPEIINILINSFKAHIRRYGGFFPNNY
ncbi:hypothetical protein GYA49_06465 [Candidatus Beckwithbacteria bacterium]|nr:hypothetical protein [Candidatus Beckwithbacteria bacterium]